MIFLENAQEFNNGCLSRVILAVLHEERFVFNLMTFYMALLFFFFFFFALCMYYFNGKAQHLNVPQSPILIGINSPT